MSCESIETLAHRRYPKALFPVRFFLSDRRAAGLGALYEGKRGAGDPRRPVRNVKWVDAFNGDVCYSRVIDVPPRDEFAPFDWTPHDLNSGMPDTVRVIRTPARHESRGLRVEWYRLTTQRGRGVVAAQLREMRRQTRPKTEESTNG